MREGFPTIKDTFSGIPRMRILSFWALFRGACIYLWKQSYDATLTEKRYISGQEKQV